MIENGSKVIEKQHNTAKLKTRFEDNLAVFLPFSAGLHKHFNNM